MSQDALSSAHRFAYDIFISFRGEDTRKNFTDHLYNALINAGFRTFRDDDEIERGENIESALRRGIYGSRMSVIIISKNYATSRWCLDEFVMIIKRYQKDGHMVFPVFYHVSKSDVENQSGSFAVAFAAHEKMFESQMERVKEWRAALRQVSDKLEGLALLEEADQHEAKFIQKIVTKIGSKLKREPLYVASHPIGLDSRVKELDLWLRNESDSEVGLAVICGIAGIGKTTIAKVLYNLHYDRFDGHCFLANVRSRSKQHNGSVGLQTELLSNLFKGRNDKIFNVGEGVTILRDVIGRKIVLIVLDDVDQADHIDTLLGQRDLLHSGSKVIITTRHEKLLKLHESFKLHRVKEFNADESLKLFSRHAFGKDRPDEGFLECSESIVRTCDGLPNVLIDRGDDLSGRNDMAIWESALKKYESIPLYKLQKDLKYLEDSYHNLQDVCDKDLFLLLACIFVGRNKDDTVKYLERHDLSATVGIENLMDRSLVTIDDENNLTMPQVLKRMGREIIRQEADKNPERIRALFRVRSSSTSLPEEDIRTLMCAENVELILESHFSIKGSAPSGIIGGKRHRRQVPTDLEMEPSQGGSFKRLIHDFFSWLPAVFSAGRNTS